MTLVKQGTDECLAACLAMLADVKLPAVKRKLKKTFGISWRDLVRGYTRGGLLERRLIPKAVIVNWLFDTFAPELGDGPKVAGTFNGLNDKRYSTPHWTRMEHGEGLAFIVGGNEAHAVCFKDGRVFDANWDFTWPVYVYFTVTLQDYPNFVDLKEVRTWIFKKS